MSFASQHIEFFLAVPLGVAAWYATSFIGAPILELERQRREALRLAERYAFYSWQGDEREDDERSNAVRREIFGAAASMLALYRSAQWSVRHYCRVNHYDIEQASAGLRGIAAMSGEARFSELTRQDTLSHVFVTLRADRHLTDKQRAAYRKAIDENKQQREPNVRRLSRRKPRRRRAK